MDFNAFEVERLSAEHVASVTSLWRESMSAALGVLPVNSFESQSYYLQNILPKDYEVWVVIETITSNPVAFMANSETEVNQLYVAPEYQRQGVGSHLIKEAKERSKGVLSLRTFEVNQRAQVFYHVHGFIAYSGSSDNEENLPDLQLVWKRSG